MVDSESPSLGLSRKSSGKRSLRWHCAGRTSSRYAPPIVWRNALDSTREASVRALTYRLDPLPNQKSWTEIPFGTPDRKARNDLPWDPSRPVEIPKTGGVIQGHIDRLDLSGDNRRARVIDYKTGRLNNNMAEVVVKGGSELQRCLYAFAVQTLLGPKIDVEASLLYPRAPEGEQALFPLDDVNAALELLAGAIAIARTNVENGLALPGTDAPAASMTSPSTPSRPHRLNRPCSTPI
jgi:PD-(D/E)XK nuclease superfamily